MSEPAPVTAERANPRGLPQPLTAICGLLALVGAAAFVWGLASDPATAWRAFHVNFVYYASLAQGGLVLACAFVIVGAHWPGPVRRIAEALAAWVPVSFVLGVIGIFGGRYLFPWIEDPVPAKEAWLNPLRFYATDLAILGVLALLTWRFLKISVRPALGGEDAPTGGRFAAWTAGWRGEEAEREASQASLRRLAPVICLLYAFGYTVLGFDQVMSIEPLWYSNMFGGYFAWGGFLSAVAATSLVAVLLRRAPGLEGHITAPRLHDLGKMVFAFSIFWMYLFWAQYLVIWYGNLPEETSYFQARLGPQFLQHTWDFALYRLNAPYARLTLLVWACCWIVPFWVLLGQRPKRTPAILGGVAAIVCLGFWLERNVLVWPSLVPGDGSAWMGPLQLAIAAGFLGAFVLVFLVYTRVFPSLVVPRRP